MCMYVCLSVCLFPRHLNTGSVRSKAPAEQEVPGGATEGGDDDDLSDAEPEEGSSSAVRDQRRQQESQEYDGEEQERDEVEEHGVWPQQLSVIVVKPLKG